MPWKECKPMDERLRFIARLLEGEKMAGLCREFGISRVTGYKIFNRYKDCGLDALNDRSRRPYRQSNKMPFQVEPTILGILLTSSTKQPNVAPLPQRETPLPAYVSYSIRSHVPKDLRRRCWNRHSYIRATILPNHKRCRAPHHPH